MKKNLIILLVSLLVGLTSFSQNVSGVYNTDLRQMTLNQIGNKVTGTYEGANGKLQAILNGNRLVGTWRNSANNKTGNFEFIFNSDYSSFTGKYGYNSDTPTKKWNGTKTKSYSSTTIVQTPSASLSNISGEYSTDFGRLTLNQNGNMVNGNYTGGNGTVKGIIEGNRFTGTWKNSSNSRTGNFDFVFNSNFSSFTGKYGYNTDTPTKKWNGTKVKSLGSTTITPPIQTNLPINIFGSWAHRGAKDQDDRLNIWQEGNRFVIVISWIDINTKIWKSYKGEGEFEGRKMNFKVFPSVINGETIDQGYEYHYTISPDNNLITGYYSKYGKRNPDANWYYQRVTE